MGLCLAVFIALIVIDKNIYEVGELMVSFMVNAVTATIGLMIAGVLRHFIFGNAMIYIVLA